MDKIDNAMSALDQTERLLSDHELDAVTGGVIPIITAAALWFICTNNCERSLHRLDGQKTNKGPSLDDLPS